LLLPSFGATPRHPHLFHPSLPISPSKSINYDDSSPPHPPSRPACSSCTTTFLPLPDSNCP
jgi:hypothetical protein